MALIFFQAEKDHFTHPPHQRIQAFRLRVAATETGNGRDEVTFFILLNQDREFSRRLQDPSSEAYFSTCPVLRE